MELSYQRYVLADGHGGGRVHALGFGGYLPTGAVRLGAWGEGGVRRYALGQDDVLLRANLLVGYQHRGDLAPLVPYVGALGTFGLVLGKRFHTPVRHRIRGAGLEAGLDVNLAGTLWAGVSFAWVRATMRDLAYDLLAVRVRVGL